MPWGRAGAEGRGERQLHLTAHVSGTSWYCSLVGNEGCGWCCSLPRQPGLEPASAWCWAPGMSLGSAAPQHFHHPGRAGVTTKLLFPFLPRRKRWLWEMGQALTTAHDPFGGRPAPGKYLAPWEREGAAVVSLDSVSTRCAPRENALKQEEHLGMQPGALCDQPGFVLAYQDSGMNQGGVCHWWLQRNSASLLGWVSVLPRSTGGRGEGLWSKGPWDSSTWGSGVNVLARSACRMGATLPLGPFSWITESQNHFL